MQLSPLEQRLCDTFARFEIIDAREHLPPEKEYLAFDHCGPNSSTDYVLHDLASAGMPLEIKRTMRNAGYRPMEDWRPQIAPYWDTVRHSPVARVLAEPQKLILEASRAPSVEFRWKP